MNIKLYTKKLVTYREEEEEPNEAMQRSWSLTEEEKEKKKNLMNIYNTREKIFGPLQRRRRGS